MRLILVFIFVSIGQVFFAQSILWEKSYGGLNADYLMDAIPTPDYGFILAGSSLSGNTGNKTSVNTGDLDYWVWKMKENGDLEWQKSFGGSGADFLQSISLTVDGGFILAGTSNSNKEHDKTDNSHGLDDFWIIKLDAKGRVEWQKTIGGSSQEKLQTIKQTNDGGYIIGGSSSSDISGEKKTDSFGNLDYWLVKIDKKGEIIWQRTFGGRYFDELRSVIATKDGGYFVGGYSNSPISGNKTEDNVGIGDYWVLKLDAMGNILWQRTIGGNADDQLSVVHQSYDGNFIVGGNSNSNSTDAKQKNNAQGTDFWILKLGSTGDTFWQETYNIAEVDLLSAVTENKDHTLLLGGYAKSELNGSSKKQKEEREINDYVVIKVAENGAELWRKSVGSDGEDVLKKLIETRDGGYILAGTSNATPQKNNIATANVGTAGKLMGLDTNQENQQLQNAKSEVNAAIKEVADEANEYLKSKTDGITQKVNKAVNKENSPLSIGIAGPTGGIALPVLGENTNGNNAGAGSAANNAAATDAISAKGKKSSRDQSKTYGSNDFWVVKLKDKDKPKVEQLSIEAFPNPTNALTNIIVGYDYNGGVATIVDLAGRLLEQIVIKNRTVPIDLSNYPDGVYIVNISTDVQSDGIKIVKSVNKN